jgi:hypothetical protein
MRDAIRLPCCSQDSANTTPFAQRKPTSTGLGEHPLGNRRIPSAIVSLRHNCAALSVRQDRELLGHKDAKTTVIYTHACTEQSEGILKRGGLAVSSPLDVN